MNNIKNYREYKTDYLTLINQYGGDIKEIEVKILSSKKLSNKGKYCFNENKIVMYYKTIELAHIIYDECDLNHISDFFTINDLSRIVSDQNDLRYYIYIHDFYPELSIKRKIFEMEEFLVSRER